MRIAAIGEQTAVAGYGLAGALVLAAEDRIQTQAAWRSLPADIAVVVVTAAAAEALQELVGATEGPMLVVIAS